MMSEPKPFASLSSTLLARKGHARPAMRPQLGLGTPDDLGWNDMGHDLPVATPSPALVQQTAIAREFRVTPNLSQAVQRKAAFTLRLDAERHLRLRLASTVRNCSAQQFVTEALDQLLATMPELDLLAGQIPTADPAARRWRHRG
jgi:hypothetical protein